MSRDVVPQPDAAGDRAARGVRGLHPFVLVPRGHRHQHLPRPGTMALPVQFDVPLQASACSGLTISLWPGVPSALSPKISQCPVTYLWAKRSAVVREKGNRKAL